MSRISRMKFPESDAWYHLYSRVAAYKGEYPLLEAASMRRLIQTIHHYSAIYFCDVAAFCVMGNHYHLVIKFHRARPVEREELRARARLMYPSRTSQARIDLWTEDDWEHYRQRLFDVSEYMRNVQSAFARWFNKSHQRYGRFWANRFKSVYLADPRALLDCMLYVELNPVRAGLVGRPEEWQGSSLIQRELGRDGWLAPLETLLAPEDAKEALAEYRQRLYYRGSVPTKEGQEAISQEVLEQEVARGFTVRGFYRRRLRYFVDGLAIGSESFLREQLAQLRESGHYLRRKHPIPHLGGIHLSLRGQRSPAASY